MQTPKRAAISVSFFSAPDDRATHGSNNTACFFVLVCVLAQCAATAFVRDRRRWATVSKMYAAYAVSIKSIACAYPHGCPRKSLATYKSQCQSRTRVSVYTADARTHTHARHPSIRNIQPIRPSSVVRVVPGRTSVTHTRAHTNTNPSTLHLCDSLLLFSHICFLFCWFSQFFFCCVLMLPLYVAPRALGIQQSRLSSLTRTRTYTWATGKKKRIHFRARARAVSPHPSERLPGDWNGCTIFDDFSDRAR